MSLHGAQNGLAKTATATDWYTEKNDPTSINEGSPHKEKKEMNEGQAQQDTKARSKIDWPPFGRTFNRVPKDFEQSVAFGCFLCFFVTFCRFSFISILPSSIVMDRPGDFLMQNFDLRKEDRDNEIDSLKNAKAILAGAGS